MKKKNREIKTMINRGFLASVGLLCATLVNCSSATAAEKNLFNQLVESARGEMAKTQGKLSVLLDLSAKEVTPVLRAFQKEFSFVKDTIYTRMNRTEEFQRLILESKPAKPARGMKWVIFD